MSGPIPRIYCVSSASRNIQTHPTVGQFEVQIDSNAMYSIQETTANALSHHAPFDHGTGVIITTTTFQIPKTSHIPVFYNGAFLSLHSPVSPAHVAVVLSSSTTVGTTVLTYSPPTPNSTYTHYVLRRKQITQTGAVETINASQLQIKVQQSETQFMLCRRSFTIDSNKNKVYGVESELGTLLHVFRSQIPVTPGLTNSGIGILAIVTSYTIEFDAGTNSLDPLFAVLRLDAFHDGSTSTANNVAILSTFTPSATFNVGDAMMWEAWDVWSNRLMRSVHSVSNRDIMCHELGEVHLDSVTVPTNAIVISTHGHNGSIWDYPYLDIVLKINGNNADATFVDTETTDGPLDYTTHRVLTSSCIYVSANDTYFTMHNITGSAIVPRIWRHIKVSILLPNGETLNFGRTGTTRDAFVQSPEWDFESSVMLVWKQR